MKRPPALVRSLGLATLGLASLAVLAAPAPAAAQILGFKGGVSVAGIDVDHDDLDTGHNTGWVAGSFFNWSWGPFGFQPEISYAQMGFEQRRNSDEDVDLQYITGTALVKIGIPLVVVKPSVFGGLAYGIKTHCDVGGEDCDDAGFDIKSTDTSAVLGADIAVFIGSVSLWGDGRYSIGIEDINDGGALFSGIKNRAWMFQAGLGFKL